MWGYNQPTHPYTRKSIECGTKQWFAAELPMN
ncbi:hypothetical protein F383_18870 [Gossypium arboreum]|uniref:Uncharacterized protein n=1 Tax=Gossypium arboreum TaxID=29729 RepID=A0A0B0MI85_GOSAR|nr:hypothetical protein F383_18870 [Gossypium arboreum]